MATVKMDVREIRQTVYGRDMREPIADGLEQIGITGSRSCQDLQKKVQTVKNEQGERVTAFSAEQISGDYYRLVVTRANGH